MRRSSQFSVLLVAVLTVTATWLLSSHPARAQTGTPKKLVSTCATENTDGLEYSYCIDEKDPSENPDILHFLHGDGGSEQSWGKESELRSLREEWAQTNRHVPTVISISFGPQWLLTQKVRGPIADLHAYFTNVLMTKLEGKLSRARKGQRILLGVSMGGFNAAMLLLKSGSHFKKVALVCPSLLASNPFSETEEERKTHTRLIRSELSSSDEWPKHDPLSLAKARLTKTSPALYISAGGGKDESEAAEATSKLASIAIEKGMDVEYHSLKGMPCSMDQASLARFLVAQSHVTKNR